MIPATAARGKSTRSVMGNKMLKTLNFILNQAGFVVVLGAILLVYYEILELTWKFALVVGLILLGILIASQVVYKSLRKDSRERHRNTGIPLL